MTRTLALELGVLLVAAGVVGAGASRGCLAPRLLERVGGRRAAPEPTASVPSPPPFAQPTDATHADTPTRESARTPPRTAASAQAAPNEHPRATALPARLSRAGGVWRIDLRDGASLESVLSGADAALDEHSGSGGYRVTAPDSAGLLAAMGIAPGDVLVAANSLPTLTADQALDAYAACRTARVVSLRFRRGQAHYTVTVERAMSP